MHDETSHDPHDQPPSDAPRCEAATHIVETLGLCGLIALTKATPQHLHPLMKSLLDASTQEEFFRIRQDAVREYASLSSAQKRELIQRLCTALPPEALKELGQILDPPPPQAAAHAHPNTIQLSRTLGTCMDDVLHALGPELTGLFAAIFEAETQETLEHALDQFSEALEAAPDRASAAAEEPGLRLVRATLRLIARHRRTAPAPPISRLTKFKAGLALVRQSLRGGVLGGAMGLAAPPLFATAGALIPFLALAFEKFPPQLQSELHARLQALRNQHDPLGWFR